MAAEKYNFQYCQKLVVFDNNGRVLLARRKGEADYDGTYSFIGGKLEDQDGEPRKGVLREKREEIGNDVTILVAMDVSYNVFFRKKDGNSMVLSHLYAQYVDGVIELSDEYSDYKWVPQEDIATFEPKIETIPDAVKWALKISQIIPKEYMTLIK